MSERNDFHYDAFISYRHNEFDSFVAENLHKKLENFKLPKSVLPKVENGKKKIERVFRDVDELPLTDNLSDPISKALLNSDYLITICTPRYPESRWCMKEIEVFLQTHPRDHILVVLAEDEPVNSFPEILCYEDIKTTNENGETVITRRELEPLAADTRGSNKKEVLKAMDIAVIKLCAAMFGLNYDDLKQRHREQRMRRLAMIFGSIGAAVLAFAIFATVMLIKISKQNITISQQYQQLQDSFATTMAAASERLLGDGRRMDAVYAVRKVLPKDGESEYNAKALKALYSDMGVYKISEKYSPALTYDADSSIYYFRVSPDKKYVLTFDQSVINIFDAATGAVVRSITGGKGYIEARFCGDDGVLWSDEDGSYYYSLTSGESTSLDIPSNARFWISDDGKMTLAEGGEDSNVYYVLDGYGKTVFTADLSEVLGDSYIKLNSVDYCDGKILCCLYDLSKYYLVMIDSADGTIVDTFEGNAYYEPLVCQKGNRLYVTESVADGPGFSFDVVAIDTTSKKHIWERKIDDFDNSGGKILLTGDRLYVCGVSQVAVVDPVSGELKNRFLSRGYIMESSVIDDELIVMTEDGRIYSCNDYSMPDITDLMFETKPGQNVFDAVIADADGKIFCQLGSANYVTLYTKEISPFAEEVDEEYESGTVESVLSWEDIEDKEKYDINPAFVDILFFSNDGKYLFADFSNNVVSVFDKETGEKIWSETKKSDDEFTDFRYSNLTGSYILSTYEYSYIFDKNMQVICETEMVMKEVDDSFIFMSENSETGYYKVPYMDMTKICQMADELLGDYEPAIAVKQKYGLN